MRKYFLLSSLILAVVFSGCSRESQEIKVVSFNIRYDNPDDGVNAWPNRIPIVEEYLLNESPDIIGFQEALHHQVIELESLLPGYQRVGSGRTDGKQEGEYTPVFFKQSIFELADQGQFWLSETPDIPGSIGPGAVLPRIATWAKLIHRPSKTTLFIFNTHYSHVSDEARKLAAEIMSGRMKEIAGNDPLILMGDFNIEYQSETYQQVSRLFQSENGLINTAENPKEDPAEVMKTYQGFSEENPGAFIDFIFVNEHFKVRDYSIDRIRKDEVFISDHWPVKSIVELLELD